MLATYFREYEESLCSSNFSCKALDIISACLGPVAEDLVAERLKYVRQAHNCINRFRESQGLSVIRGREFASKLKLYQLPEFKTGILKENYLEFINDAFVLKAKEPNRNYG